MGSGKGYGRGSGKIQGIRTPSHVYKHVNEQGKSGGNDKNEVRKIVLKEMLQGSNHTQEVM